MAPMTAPPAAARCRLIGRSRRYDASGLPARLRRWHAPRANRWERIEVAGGPLGIDWLAGAATRSEELAPGTCRWVPPGQRWRVRSMAPDTSFALSILADDAQPAATAQPVRARLLEETPRRAAAAAHELQELATALKPGARLVVLCPQPPWAWRPSAPPLSWHPLGTHAGTHALFLWRAPAAVTLDAYLGRDHALIEAALAGTLRGDPACAAWLPALLTRHLQIEEALLFPPWLAAGGPPGWARGLENEHRQLRRDLAQLHQPVARRRFLLLLDGHDEKEEQRVYPDILARIGTQADALLAAAMDLPPAALGDSAAAPRPGA